MDTEQGSLSMLFKGITFTATINSERLTRDKTYEENILIEKLTESQMAADGAGSAPGTEYHTQTISKEIKHINVSIAFPKNFSGSLELEGLDERLNKNFANYIYLFDDVGNVSRISLISSRESVSNRNAFFTEIDNKHLVYQEENISVKDGQELWYNIRYDKIKKIEKI